MAEAKEYLAKSDETGSVAISDDVIAAIAGVAAAEVEGIASLGSVNVVDFIGKKNAGKGVKIAIADDAVEISVSLSVKKGNVIPAVAKAVQENVASAVESMTGIEPSAVNVKVIDVAFDKEPKKKN